MKRSVIAMMFMQAPAIALLIEPDGHAQTV